MADNLSSISHLGGGQMRSPFRYHESVVIEIGQVKQFGGGHGFLRILDEHGNPSGKDIFFHMVDRQIVQMVAEPAQWNQPFFTPIAGDSPPPEPQVGDLLVFVHGFRESDGKHRAVAWAPLEHWQAAEAVLQQHRRTFRLRVTYKPRYSNSLLAEQQPKDVVIWQGTDVLRASMLFPVTPTGRDSLVGWPRSTDWWAASYLWEVQGTDEHQEDWTPCPDPRVPDCCLPSEELPKGWLQTTPCVHLSEEPSCSA